MKACIYCAEQIQDGARLCRYCGREQVDPTAERVLYEGSPRHGAHALSYAGAAVLVIAFGVGLLVAAWIYLRIRTEKWKITNRAVEHRQGILARRTDVLPLWRVHDLRHEQTVMQRLLGDGRIVLTSTDPSDPVLELRGLPNHEALYENLRVAIDAARREQRVVAVDS